MLAENAGCSIGKTGGILVNEKSETSIKHIYAVGDCTEYIDYVTGDAIPVGLGSITVRQGIAAGVNAAGGSYQLPKGFLQTFTSRFFNHEIAAVGPLQSSIDQIKIINGKYTGSSLPDYFPGGKPIVMKVTAEVDSGKILSAQAFGENAAQRINTYATAILADMTIDQMKLLETAYAPPVAPTLDVVTVVADIVDFKRQRKKK
jgi:NADH oxidase (H2O2-forming)